MRKYPSSDGTALPSYGPSDDFEGLYEHEFEYEDEGADMPIPPYVDTIVYVRRMLTAQIIQLANKADGGTTTLVSVEETVDGTRIVFETDYYLQNMPEERGVRKQVKRYTVWIAQEIENVPNG